MNERTVIDVRLVQTRDGTWRARVEGALVVAGARDPWEALSIVSRALATVGPIGDVPREPGQEAQRETTRENR